MNKKSKLKPHHIDISGVRFCFPKGARKKLNKANPSLKGKKLGGGHLPKVLKVLKP